MSTGLATCLAPPISEDPRGCGLSTVRNPPPYGCRPLFSATPGRRCPMTFLQADPGGAPFGTRWTLFARGPPGQPIHSAGHAERPAGLRCGVAIRCAPTGGTDRPPGACLTALHPLGGTAPLLPTRDRPTPSTEAVARPPTPD